jgi:hypothetical protein
VRSSCGGLSGVGGQQLAGRVRQRRLLVAEPQRSDQRRRAPAEAEQLAAVDELVGVEFGEQRLDNELAARQRRPVGG